MLTGQMSPSMGEQSSGVVEAIQLTQYSVNHLFTVIEYFQTIDIKIIKIFSRFEFTKNLCITLANVKKICEYYDLYFGTWSITSLHSF